MFNDNPFPSGRVKPNRIIPFMKNRLPISYSTGVEMKNRSSYLCSNSCPSFMDGVQGGVRSSWNVRIHDPQAISSLPNYTSATTLDHSTRRATATTTRPAWGSGARAVTTTPVSSRPRTRNTSQTSGVGPRASKQSLASPAPSEDSGVGLYRQLMAKDSKLNGL